MSPGAADGRRRSSDRGSCGAIPQGRSTSQSTCGSPEPYAALVLVVAGPLRVRPLGGRRQVLEDDLREPPADPQPQGRGSVRVHAGGGEGPAGPPPPLPPGRETPPPAPPLP